MKNLIQRLEEGKPRTKGNAPIAFSYMISGPRGNLFLYFDASGEFIGTGSATDEYQSQPPKGYRAAQEGKGKLILKPRR